MGTVLDFSRPHVLRTEEEYEAAIAEIGRLLDEDVEAGSEGYDRLELLSVLVEHYEDELKALLTLHVKNTQSRFAERILAEFDREVGHFWQIVPKEMLDKLEVPVRGEVAVALTA